MDQEADATSVPREVKVPGGDRLFPHAEREGNVALTLRVRVRPQKPIRHPHDGDSVTASGQSTAAKRHDFLGNNTTPPDMRAGPTCDSTKGCRGRERSTTTYRTL
jgi:hypothetical protein